METRRLTKLFMKRAFCLYCDCKLISQDKKIGYKVKLFFEKDLNKLSEGLLENIYNGLTLSGKLEVFKWEEKILQDVLKKENYLRQG